jgi:hypothetical protein
MRGIRPIAAVCALVVIVVSAGRADSFSQTFDDFTIPMPVRPGDTLLLGIVGGWERWDNPVRCIRSMAIEFKRQRRADLHVETVENHKLHLAEELVRRAFDFDRDGVLSPEEAAQARVVVFGQSLGGRATVVFTRTLYQMGIAVPLAVIVDAYGPDSYEFPPNVAAAANFYQRDHAFIKGAPRIRANRVLANQQFHYPGKLFSAHDVMEYDPAVWTRVRELLTSATAPRGGSPHPRPAASIAPSGGKPVQTHQRSSPAASPRPS